MNPHVRWVADLKAPSQACKREHAGVPLVVSAEDIQRADIEMAKGLHDVVFHPVLISPRDGNAYYILGSIA